MTPPEKPFRPSTELQNEWLTETDKHHMISFTPPPAEMTEWAKGMREYVLEYLTNANPFGIELKDGNDDK